MFLKLLRVSSYDSIQYGEQKDIINTKKLAKVTIAPNTTPSAGTHKHMQIQLFVQL